MTIWKYIHTFLLLNHCGAQNIMTFMENSMNWLTNSDDLRDCFIINFGYDDEITLPQIAVSVDEEIMWNIGTHGMNIPNECSIVIVAGKYLKMVDAVMMKVDQISENIDHIPTAIYIIENLDQEKNYKINMAKRNHYSPALVVNFL